MPHDERSTPSESTTMNAPATVDRRNTPISDGGSPYNVFVAPDTRADRAIRARHRLLRADAIAPGVHPTPAHDLIFHGGTTLPDLSFTNFYVGGDGAWDPADIQAIDDALARAMADRRLNNVMAQYFPDKEITSRFLPSVILPGTPPATVSQGDIENLVRSLHADGRLQGFDLGTTLFNCLLPRGTVLNTDPLPTGLEAVRSAVARRANPVVHEDEDSGHGLGGYHGSVHISELGGAVETVYYAVGVFSEQRADGTVNGIPVFDQPWKNVVATFYHELNEARTDADIEDAIRAGNDPAATQLLGWVSRRGEECGDFPVFEAKPLTKVFQEVPLADGSGTVPVQFQYSNAVHGPEGPIDTPH